MILKSNRAYTFKAFPRSKILEKKYFSIKYLPTLTKFTEMKLVADIMLRLYFDRLFNLKPHN